MVEKYIGLISGTSADGIEAVLLQFDGERMELLAHHHRDYPAQIAELVHEYCRPGAGDVEGLGQLDQRLGNEFARAAQDLLSTSGHAAGEITAIGSHGQTVRHRPPSSSRYPFSLQLGDANIIAENCGITTVADFRRRDLAAGGEGAPLAPAFHRFAFGSDIEKRVIVNIGGIANITDIDSGIGFDTGPGNTLMDAWIQHHRGASYDDGGSWAATGNVDQQLLAKLSSDPFLSEPPPKSTGRELFHLAWLQDHLTGVSQRSPEDVQATLLELTATTIVNAINTYRPGCEALYVCGGGAYNDLLMCRLSELASLSESGYPVASTAQLGIEPTRVEAAAFAWLARQTLLNRPGNIPAATGARGERILGAIYSR